MKTAIEPCQRIVEGDRFKRSKRWRVSLAPGMPEALVACMRVEEDSQFANVMHDPVSEEEIAQYVKREVCKVVYWAKAGKRESFNFAHGATLPKEFGLRNVEMRDAFVPQAEVEFDAEWHRGVERVASPLPIAAPHKRRSVVGKCVADLCVRKFVADGPQCFRGDFMALRGTEYVDVGLRSQPRVCNIGGRLCKALENDMVDACKFKRFGSFSVSSLDAFESECVIGNIGSEPADNPIRKPLHGELSNL
ncbi:MAG: hypothetical protein ABSF53_04535 [Terracidiphilus sp.]